jgi:protein phosphatase
MKLEQRTLVLLCGPIGSGKSTFASKWFGAHIVSADTIREMISGDAGNQNVSREAFDILYTLVDVKMRHGFPVVIDNLNHNARSRRDWFKLADKYGYKKIAIVFDHVDNNVCQAQNAGRKRVVPADIVKKSVETFFDGLKHLAEDDINEIIHASSVNEPFVFQDTSVVNSVEIVDKAVIIGDTHGCLPELIALIEDLRIKGLLDGRKIVFVGDFADRGPSNAGTLEYIMNLVEQGLALAVRGNHDDKLRRYLMGNNIKLGHGIAETVNQIEAREDAKEFKAKLLNFISSLPLYLVLDGGKLVVAHAGIEDSMIGKDDKGAIRTFCLFGKITGNKDENGFPERLDWAAERVVNENSPWIVYGHAAQTNGKPYIINKTANVDTACCFGGKLTAFVYPEAETVSVDAYAKYADHASGELVRD